MKLLLRTVASAFMFAGILAGCLAILLLVILMVRFPQLLIVVLLAFNLYKSFKRLPVQPPTLYHQAGTKL